ncbi:MAG: SHOCT domain-containing protein [Frankiaceae bacterium]
MIVRRRPLLRAAAVGGAGYMAGKRSAQRADQGADQNQQIQQLQQQGAQSQPPPPPAPAASQSSADRIAALSQLKELLDQGVLTQAEFDAEKAKLLQGG